MNIFFIDYETTGLNPYYNEPIEIAVKKLDSENYFQSLITPELNGINYQYVPQKIQEITGITDKDIIKYGKNIDDVSLSLLEYMKNNSGEGPIYILAHLRPTPTVIQPSSLSFSSSVQNPNAMPMLIFDHLHFG